MKKNRNNKQEKQFSSLEEMVKKQLKSAKESFASIIRLGDNLIMGKKCSTYI